MAFRRIDMTQYARRSHFEHFLSMAYPYVGVTQNVDVTKLVRFCKEKGYSFYLTFLHAAALAGDEVPQLRQRIHEGGIVEYDACPTSHIELLEDETYCYCTLHHHMSMEEYIPYAEEMRAKCRQKASIEEDDDVESMYFISSLPWLHYSAMIQPTAGGEDSNPRFTWGRYEEDLHGRLQMPVTLLAHHSLADGIHIARFYRKLDEVMGKIVFAE